MGLNLQVPLSQEVRGITSEINLVQCVGFEIPKNEHMKNISGEIQKQ